MEEKTKREKRIELADKKQYFEVEENIFKRKIKVFLNYTPEDYDKWCKKNGVIDERGWSKEFMASSFEFDHEDRATQWGIFIKHFNWSIGSQGSLIHEIVHTIIKIWSVNNIPYNKDTQEFLAHSIAGLYEDISAKILKVKKIQR